MSWKLNFVLGQLRSFSTSDGRQNMNEDDKSQEEKEKEPGIFLILSYLVL